MTTPDAQGNLHGQDGRFQTKTRGEATVELSYQDRVLAEIRDGADIDAIASRDHWGSSDWERYYDAQGGGDFCPDCGVTIEGGNSTDDGVCLPCAHPDEYLWCALCGGLASQEVDETTHHLLGTDEHAYAVDIDHAAVA